MQNLKLILEKTLSNWLPGKWVLFLEILDEDVFEVEFSDDSGKAYAMLSIKKEGLIHLHYSPVAA